jgi:hypothetical protein
MFDVTFENSEDELVKLPESTGSNVSTNMGLGVVFN